MKYQPITPAEAARLLRSLIYQYTAEGLADMCAEACTAEAITAQENNELPSVVAELQRGAHHLAEASARMYSDRAELHAGLVAARAKPSADEMSAALKNSGFFIGGLSDEAITHHYGAMVEKAAGAAAKN